MFARNIFFPYNHTFMTDKLTNILILKPSALGDIVLALPALTALRRSFPDAKISWLVRPEFAPLLENHPHLDKIITFDRKILSKVYFSLKALGALNSLIKELRQSKFDAVFDFQGLFRSAILAWLSGCKKRFGMANSREMAHLFYTHKIKQDSDSIHLVDFYLKIAEAAGANNTDVEFILPSIPEAANAVDKLLESRNIQSGQYVVLVPGSAHIDKCWLAERFAQLADKISSKFNLPIVAIGTNSEKIRVEEINKLTDTKIIDFAGQTSLKELIELMRSAKLVISNDTGPGHIASALGTPLVMMYSWSNPARIAPYGRPECMVARDPYSRGMEIKSDNPKHSVINITVDEVFEKVCEQLTV